MFKSPKQERLGFGNDVVFGDGSRIIFGFSVVWLSSWRTAGTKKGVIV